MKNNLKAENVYVLKVVQVLALQKPKEKQM